MDGRVIRTLRALTLATIVLSLAAQPVLGWDTRAGNTSCTSVKRVWIYSTARFWVWHYSRNNTYVWHNFAMIPHENNTFASQTWWAIDADDHIHIGGAECRSI